MLGIAQHFDRSNFGMTILEEVNKTIPLHSIEMSILEDKDEASYYYDFIDVLDDTYRGKTNAGITELVHGIMEAEEFVSNYGKKLRVYLCDEERGIEFCVDIEMRGTGEDNKATYATLISTSIKGHKTDNIDDNVISHHSAYFTINGKKVCILLDGNENAGYGAYSGIPINR